MKRKLLRVYRRLLKAYGPPERVGLDPVSEMVSTILSQNTSDVNRDRGYQRLRERFPAWEAVRDAPVDQVEEAIRPAGLSAQKAPRIQQALRAATMRGGQVSLDFLRGLSVDEARAWLTSINGIGPKTAAIILLFSLDIPAFPVDTHIHRVAGRLGFIGPRVTAEKAHGILESLAPPELYLPLHMLLITHGRRTCHARRPACEACPVRDLCEYYALLAQHATATEASQG